MTDFEDRNYLIQAAAWQETLLQAYRSLHVTIQSILLAVGVGLTVASLTIGNYPKVSPSVVVCTVLLTTIACLHMFSSRAFSGVVHARGEDINWWHCEIIRKEHNLPPEIRYFTKFKIHQQARRKDVTHLEKIYLTPTTETTLTDDQILELIGKGLGHTRRVIDQQLFNWINKIWWLLLLTAWSSPLFSLGKYAVEKIMPGSA